MSERRRIRCDGHGDAWETYVCKHLLGKPAQEWFSEHPEEDNPWPDAWCAKCDRAFAREGEWNERNEAECPIELVCSACYVEQRMRSVEAVKGKEKRRWDAFVAEACRDLAGTQKAMVADLKLEAFPRWDVDMQKATLAFSGEGLAPLVLEIEAIGSFASTSATWLWAWCNWHLPAIVRGRVRAVRELGERERFLHLMEPKWQAAEHDGWHMAAIAARHLGALGVYRMPGEVVSFAAIMGRK